MHSPLAITGLGVVSSLGLGLEQNWRRLTAGESGISRIARFDPTGLRATIGGTVNVAGRTVQSRTYAAARLVSEEALSDAGLLARQYPELRLFVASAPPELEWNDRAWLLRRRTSANPAELPSPASLDLNEELRFMFSGGVSAALAGSLGLRFAPVSVTTACASGSSAIQCAAEAIAAGACKMALVIGADCALTPELVARFSLLSALSSSNENPSAASKPFSKNRDGFVLAEGAGALVLEEISHARARGAKIHSFLLGHGDAADSFHRTRSNPSGDSLVRCMSQALSSAKLEPSAIQYINAHGTSTPENDAMESKALARVFGSAQACPPISSNKSMIGHTLTAAGAIEAVFTVQTLRTGILPPTINYHEPDPAIPLDVVPNRSRTHSVCQAMSNSFGFGGQNVSLIFGREARP